MKNIAFSSAEEEKQFLSLLIHDDYQSILLIWGVNHLFSILKWYQYIGNAKASDLVIECIESHLDEQFKALLSERDSFL